MLYNNNNNNNTNWCITNQQCQRSRQRVPRQLWLLLLQLLLLLSAQLSLLTVGNTQLSYHITLHSVLFTAAIQHLIVWAGLRLWVVLGPKYFVGVHYTYTILYNKTTGGVGMECHPPTGMGLGRGLCPQKMFGFSISKWCVLRILGGIIMPFRCLFHTQKWYFKYYNYN